MDDTENTAPQETHTLPTAETDTATSSTDTSATDITPPAADSEPETPATSTSSTPAAGSIAAALATAVLDTEPAAKALAVAQHDVGTFLAHNEGAAAIVTPVVNALTPVVEAAAAKHGLTEIWDFLEKVIEIIAPTRNHTVATPTTPAA